ncbi:MAG: uridine monophosphate kinase [Candidatus Bipolaricaulaceae bacterium]
MSSPLRYRRAVVKLSGELLGGEAGPLNATELAFFARAIRDVRTAGAEVAVVVGGGNIARGSALPQLPPVAGHTVGMLATLINVVALREALDAAGVPARLFSALPCPGVAEPVDPWQARVALAAGQVVLWGAGTGNPFVTTDTAAVIRALSVSADAVVKASKVDGVYEDDPEARPGARPLGRISHHDYLCAGLEVMDQAAVAIAGKHGLPIVVFRGDRAGGLLAALRGELGSLIG